MSIKRSCKYINIYINMVNFIVIYLKDNFSGFIESLRNLHVLVDDHQLECSSINY